MLSRIHSWTRRRLAPRRAVIAALLCGLSSAPAVAGQDNDDALSARSDVPGIVFATLARLPRAPASAASQKSCDWMLAKPKTPGGQLAASLGWGITAEVPFGAYHAVSFAGRFEPSTSSTCEISQGNVAVFKDGQLLALAFTRKGAKDSIGSISALRGGLRIWDGGMLAAPVADMHFIDGYLFQIGAVAGEDSVCEGRGSVPNVYSQRIDKARRALIAKGWEPLKNPQDLAADKGQFGREFELSRRGVIEVDSCSGTGLAFCGYYYRQGDMELRVITAGDDEYPNVSSYETVCGKERWHQVN